MAQRTINSPGVEIRESDLSLIAPQNVGTNFYITGFAQEGPLDEVLLISSKQELDNTFGTPTNSAERYFYHSISELLNSPGTVYASRLPYGASKGDGFGSVYTALAYPVVSVTSSSTDALSNRSVATVALDKEKATYVLGEPQQLVLSNAEYLSCLDGSGFTFSDTALSAGAFDSVADLSGAGMGVLNKGQTTINDNFEGYYVGIADNTNLNPDSNFDAVTRLKTINSGGAVGDIYGSPGGAAGAAAGVTDYTTVPDGVTQFALSAEPRGENGSISEVLENLTDYDIDGREDDDVLNIGVFKLRKSTYASEAFKLDYLLEDAVVGSTNYYRKQLNPTGGPEVNFFLENQDSKSRNIEVLVNPYISNYFRGTDGQSDSPNPNFVGSKVADKKIRVFTDSLVSQLTAIQNQAAVGTMSVANQNTLAYLGLSADAKLQTSLTTMLSSKADSLYPLGAFNDQQVKEKILGDIPLKIDRALERIKNDEIYDIDVVVEGGLGTIHAASDASGTTYYDEYAMDSSLITAVNGLRTSNEITGTARTLRNNYSTIFNKFEKFCTPPFLGGDRGDCLFIADVLRQILVSGEKSRTLDNKSRNFQKDIYWPIRHQFENENTSYAAVYAQWPEIYDEYSGRNVFVPFSGFAGAAMAQTDANFFPWFAPAGFTRGLVRFANDLAINPNQKQRDELYKANINPVAFFPSQGQVIFGQKTLSKKPSAFDRINVRRLFLSLERPTKKASRFFVFEQNTEFTRQRLINVLTPLFERAKNNEGLFDYLIVCDERNNTPEVIDANELVVDIYLKPTRTAEFILVNFIATRTDANFEEIIGA